MYNSHEEEKKKEYGPRVVEYYKSTTSGGLSRECDKLVRQIAMKLSLKRGQRYSDVVGFILCMSYMVKFGAHTYIFHFF